MTRLPPAAARPLTLYLASTNPGKLREFRAAARERGVRLQPSPSLAGLAACIEDGGSFEANARKKALYYGRSVAGLVFADDSGLCVDALDGRPGVDSALFAGPGATDAAHNAKLMAALAGVAPAERTAHYVCIIALACDGRLAGTYEGRAEGVILEAPRGSNGFGYDPYFYYPPLGATFAELSEAEKFAVSHRGAAFRKLLQHLETNGARQEPAGAR